jgi:hypothetical protein
MQSFEFSTHAIEMLRERNISEAWVWQTLEAPDEQRSESDGNVHYIKSIEDCQGRFLRVVVNPGVQPSRIVTVFFDRRLGRKGEVPR